MSKAEMEGELPAEPVAAATEAADEADPLHIGNLVTILSEAHGYLTGRVVYRDLNLVRVMPQDSTDRAVEFPMTEDGSAFDPALGVSEIEVLDTQTSDYYVDFLGARPGELLEFFTVDGAEAAPSGEVAEVVKTRSKDNIVLKDGRVLRFRLRGPEPPIAVIRVRTALNVPAAVEGGLPAGEPEAASVVAAATRQRDILDLLRSVLPAATVEVVPVAERTFPDSMQREDMFQDLLSELSEKKRTNPRRIRLIEREVNLAVALKNRAIARDESGRILGAQPHRIDTFDQAVSASRAPLPAAIPIVEAARVLNLDATSVDAGEGGATYKPSDVMPRQITEVEMTAEERAALFMSGGGLNYESYIHAMMTRDLVTLTGTEVTEGWREAQDVIRTAGLATAVQGLSSGLPPRPQEPVRWSEVVPVTTAFLKSDVVDRTVRVLPELTWSSPENPEPLLLAPSDPARVTGYVVLPPKAALSLRPPSRVGDLPTALLYSARLADDNLPTIARTLADLFSRDEKTPLNAWTLEAGKASEYSVAEWLGSVLKYAVHPVDSLGPRTPALLSLLDTMGLAETDLSPSVAEVIGRWTAKSQRIWRELLIAERKRIQTLIDEEPARTFQSVTGPDSTLWPALGAADTLKDLVEDIRRRNPTIAGAPVLLSAALHREAQGDALPLVWKTIAELDAREYDLDVAVASASLAASRAYTLRRAALRNFSLLGLHAEPEINTCPHVNRLEAVRNVADNVQRLRLMRDFVEEYQGGKQGDWVTCALCTKPCVCYHELMELEAMAQPVRMDAILKQMLIRFGGERYEGKIVCKNCGQPLQDIDYDEGVEFDDDGNVITGRSVLTEEQMADPTESTWKKTTEALAPPSVTFATEAQQELATALYTMAEKGGILIPSAVLSSIVRYADLYVSLRTPSQKQVEQLRALQMKTATAKIKTATGVAGAVLPAPVTYEELLDQTRIAGLTACLALAIQTATPQVTVPTQRLPFCTFGREGWPLAADTKPEESAVLQFVSCIVASIERPSRPWVHAKWRGETKLASRTNQAMTIAVNALRVILNEDPKVPALSFTPEIKTLLGSTREAATLRKERERLSLQDQLPVGFKPEPFPPAVRGRPAVEKDPVEPIEAALAAGNTASLEARVGPVVAALRQQSLAIIHDMHAAATESVEAQPQKPVASATDGVCCEVPLTAARAGVLLGDAESMPLLRARSLLRGAQPTAVNAGTHLWPMFDTPISEPVEQTVEEGVFFKLFLKYCYRGPRVGESHEFSTGNICRQCGLALGKPLDLIDVSKEGAGILAAQQGDLRVETSRAAFDALSDAVRRRKILTPRTVGGVTTWRVGLESVIAAIQSQKALGEEDGMKQVSAALSAMLEAAAGHEDDMMEETSVIEMWAPLTAHMDTLRAEVEERVGPLTARLPGEGAKTRAREARTALAAFDTMTEDPFLEGPRAVQEYWCAKPQAIANRYKVETVNAARWFKTSQEHNRILNKILETNAAWEAPAKDRKEITTLSDDARTVLSRISLSVGPAIRAWILNVRPAKEGHSLWNAETARDVLRCLVLQAWHDAVVPTSWVYRDMAGDDARARVSTQMADVTRVLMLHARQQFVRYSEEQVRRTIQQIAEMERTSVVEEIKNIDDPDERAAVLMQKDLRMGRWGIGANVRTLDADTFDMEVEQRRRMGVAEDIVPTVEEVQAAAAGELGTSAAEGFGALEAAPEDGYDFNMGAAGDDY